MGEGKREREREIARKRVGERKRESSRARAGKARAVERWRESGSGR